MARREPTADASLPDMRPRSRPGTAIAAMMPMIATTISSSMRVKPLELRISNLLLRTNKRNISSDVREGVTLDRATQMPQLFGFTNSKLAPKSAVHEDIHV